MKRKVELELFTAQVIPLLIEKLWEEDEQEEEEEDAEEGQRETRQKSTDDIYF